MTCATTAGYRVSTGRLSRAGRLGVMESRREPLADDYQGAFQLAGDDFELPRRSLLEWLFGSWSPDDCSDVWLYYH